jgi:hypothetical protein
MKTSLPILSGIAAALLALFLFVGLVYATGQPDPGSTDEGQTKQAQSSGDETFPPEPLFPAPSAPITTTMTKVYFTPEDSDGTATYLNLYNTDTVTQTAILQAQNINGSYMVNLTIPIGGLHKVRVISDNVATSPPPSWQNTFFANFTDFSTVGILQLPPGVKAEAFMVYNGSTGTIDPRADQGDLPIRLSIDPPTIFLPTAQR